MTKPEKILILDGIGGVPLGREMGESFREHGVPAIYVDCLRERTRPLYEIRSAYAKLVNKRLEKDEFYFLPKLVKADLAALVEKEHPSHILVVGFAYKFVAPADLRRIADQAKASLLLYDTDSCNLYSKRREFIFFIERELPIYDHIFSFSRVTTDFFQKTRGLEATHLSFAAQSIELPQDGDKTIDVLFVGSCDLRRILLLEKIKDHVSVFGNRWRRNFPLVSKQLQDRIVDQPVWGGELYRLLAQSKIVLNITRSDFFGAGTGINLRIFETVAAGCFLLTDFCEEIAEQFVVGEEIETFSCGSELADKVDYYLKNHDKRVAIARRGYERFLKDHTWRARIEQLTSLPTFSSPTHSGS